MSVRGLFQAVRSQLHFSQLSAWWSSSKGTHPINVCYRVTLPGEAFASQFTRPPVHHIFPPAAVGPNTQLKVCSTYIPQKSDQNRFISRLTFSPGPFFRGRVFVVLVAFGLRLTIYCSNCPCEYNNTLILFTFFGLWPQSPVSKYVCTLICLLQPQI